MKNQTVSTVIFSLALVSGNTQAAILLTSASTGTEGVTADTTTVTIDGAGSASVPTPSDDYSTSGSISEALGFSTTFDITLDAVSVINTTVGADFGGKTTDGLIDRASGGELGVRDTRGNGIHLNEGFLIGIDATNLSASLAWQITGIRFRFLGGGEEYTVVNRANTSSLLTGTSDGLLDVTSLGLTVPGGTSSSEVVSAFLNDAGDTGNNIRITQIELDVVPIPEPSTLALFALGLGGLILRKRRVIR